MIHSTLCSQLPQVSFTVCFAEAAGNFSRRTSILGRLGTARFLHMAHVVVFNGVHFPHAFSVYWFYVGI